MPIIFRWYRHSFLASIVSLFGTATLACGIGMAVSGGILYGIGMALGGLLLLWCAGRIADRKARKIATKNAAGLQSSPASAPVRTASAQATGSSGTNSSPANPPVSQPVNRASTCTQQRETPDPVPRNQPLDQMLKLASKAASDGNTARQISILKHASEEHPDHSGVFNLLGIAYRNAGRYQESFDCYRKAATLDPNNGVIHGNYALALMMSGDYKTALTKFERALPMLKKENNVDYALYLANYAYALGQCGYAENALRCLNDAEKAGYAHADRVRSKLEKIGIHN